MCISSATAANYILEDGKVKESKQPIDFEKKNQRTRKNSKKYGRRIPESRRLTKIF